MGVFSKVKRQISFPVDGDKSKSFSQTMAEPVPVSVSSGSPDYNSKATEEVHENTFLNIKISRDKRSTTSEYVLNQCCSFECIGTLSVPFGQPIASIAGVDGHIIRPPSMSFFDLALTMKTISTRKDFLKESLHLESQISKDTTCVPTNTVTLLSFLSSIFSLSAEDVALIISERSCETLGSNSLLSDNPADKPSSENELSVKAMTTITRRPVPLLALSAFGAATAKSVQGTKRGKRSELTSDQQLNRQQEYEEKANSTTAQIFSEDAKCSNTCVQVEAVAEQTSLLLQKKKGNKVKIASAKQFEGNILWPLSTEETNSDQKGIFLASRETLKDKLLSLSLTLSAGIRIKNPIFPSSSEPYRYLSSSSRKTQAVQDALGLIALFECNGSTAIKYMLYSSANASFAANADPVKLVSKKSRMTSESSASSCSFSLPAFSSSSSLSSASLSILSVSLLRSRVSHSSVHVPPLVLNSRRVRAYFTALLTLTSIERTSTNQERQCNEGTQNSTEGSDLKGKDRGGAGLALLSNIWGALVTLHRHRRRSSATAQLNDTIGASSRKSDSSILGKKRRRPSGPIEENPFLIYSGEQPLPLPVPPPSPCSSFLIVETNSSSLDLVIPPRLLSDPDPIDNSHLSIFESESENYKAGGRGIAPHQTSRIYVVQMNGASASAEEKKYLKEKEDASQHVKMLREWVVSSPKFAAFASDENDIADALTEDFVVDSSAVDDDHDHAPGQPTTFFEANYMHCDDGVRGTDPRISSSFHSASVPKQFEDYDACLGDPYACRPWEDSVQSDFSSMFGGGRSDTVGSSCSDYNRKKHCTNSANSTNKNKNLRTETGWTSEQDDRLLIDYTCQCLSKRFNSHCPCVECCLASTLDDLSSTLAPSSSASNSEKETQVSAASLFFGQFKSFLVGRGGAIHSDEKSMVRHQSCRNEILANDAFTCPSTNPTRQIGSESDLNGNYLKSARKSDTCVSKGRSKKGNKGKRAVSPPTRSAPPKATSTSRSVANHDESLLEYIRCVGGFGNSFSSIEQLHAGSKVRISEHFADPSNTCTSNECVESGQSCTRRTAYYTACTDDTHIYAREDFRREILEAAAILLSSELLLANFDQTVL